MFSAAGVGWVLALLAVIGLVIQATKHRRKCEKLEKSNETIVSDLRGAVDARDEKISAITAALTESTTAGATLSANNRRLENELAIKNQELTANAEQIVKLEATVAEEAARKAELARPTSHVPRPRSPFEIQYTDECLLTKLLPEALRYLSESVAYRLAIVAPKNAQVHLIEEPKGDIVTCLVTRQESSPVADARKWFTGVYDEHQNLLSLKEEAKLFAVKVHLVTGHIEHLSMSECAHLARDFIHLLATGGASMLRILAGMSVSIKMDSLGRKSDHIILLLDSAQMGRLNGIFLGAGEQYRQDTIDQNRIMPLRQELLELECELLAELRCRLVSAPDVRGFQLKWGQTWRSSREAFFDSHFRGGVGKIRMAIEAFLIDLILVQDTDSRQHFFSYTVVQQAKELGKITKMLGAQLLVVEDKDRVQEVQALYRLCQQFQILLEHLVLPSAGWELASAG
jgi:hypothetical protein